MNTDDPTVVRLLSEVAELTGESPMEALRLALTEKLERLQREFKQVSQTGSLSNDQTDQLFGY
jgi:hypothetical protein